MRRAAVLVAAVATFGLPSAAAHAVGACTGAVQVGPGDDVIARVDAAGAGRTICFAAGTYRLTEPIRPRSGQTLIGHDATLSGADVLTGFVATTNGWTVGGQTQQGYRNGICAHGAAGVPSDGDSVVIAPPSTAHCAARVDNTPLPEFRLLTRVGR